MESKNPIFSSLFSYFSAIWNKKLENIVELQGTPLHCAGICRMIGVWKMEGCKMLVMFRFKNFASFKDEVILDMRAASYKQHEGHTVRTDGRPALLKTTAVYGANASGKSNLISAMDFFKSYILCQFVPKTDRLDDDRIFAKPSLDPFMLSKDTDGKTEFEIVFLCDGQQYQYGFVVDDDRVYEEWYQIEGKDVFDRVGTAISFGTQYRKLIGSLKDVAEDRLYLPLLDYFLPIEAREVIIGGFTRFFYHEYLPFKSWGLLPGVKWSNPVLPQLDRLTKDKELRDRVVQYLQVLDFSIVGLNVRNIPTFEKSGKMRSKRQLVAVHQTYDENGAPAGKKEFGLSFESVGTLRALEYLEFSIPVLEGGGVVMIDELSSSLHTLLTRFIIDLFQSEDNVKAQLIFTTHDVSLLSKEQFRRDEVVFVDKDKLGVSSLYSLSDFKPREDASFQKEYLKGKYGAIPIFADECEEG